MSPSAESLSTVTHDRVVSINRLSMSLWILASVVAIAATGRWLTALVSHRAHGLDASDESYYLGWALDPRAYVVRHADFGYYLNLIWRWSGRSSRR